VWTTHCRPAVRTKAEFLVKGSRIEKYENVGDAGGSFGTFLGWNSSNSTEECDIDCHLCFMTSDSD